MRRTHDNVGSGWWSLAAASVVLACGGGSLASDGELAGRGTSSAGGGNGSIDAPSAGASASGGVSVPFAPNPAESSSASGGSSSNNSDTGGTGGTSANGGASASSGAAAGGSETGGAQTKDGAPGTGGGTNDGTGAGGNTGDGQGGGNTGDGKGGGNTGDGARGGDTGDGARGGDTGDGARGGGTGDGCVPTCFPSVLDNVNVIALNDATADGADVEGRMYVAHDANFPSYAIGTRMTPDPTRADLVVGNDLYFGGGSVANGKVSYAGVLELGAASTLGGYHNESIVDFASVEQEMTADSAKLAALAPNGTVTTGLEVRLTGTDPTLNVFEVQAADLASMTSLILSAPASSSVVINIRGDSVSLHDFGFTLAGVVREQILYNLPEATSLSMSGVGIQGSLLAPYVDLDFANGHIDGQLVVRNFSGSGESHPKYFIGCLPLCQY
jgi:choice-of-anchor A domain-containing protein